MTPSIQERLFHRLSDLIPHIDEIQDSETFYAPARIKDDLALDCVVTKIDNNAVEIELAHDLVIEGEEQPCPWMVFKANTLLRTAELLAIHDERSFCKIQSVQGYVDPRHTPLHIYAINWLAVFIHMRFVFQPFANPAVAA